MWCGALLRLPLYKIYKISADAVNIADALMIVSGLYLAPQSILVRIFAIIYSQYIVASIFHRKLREFWRSASHFSRYTSVDLTVSQAYFCDPCANRDTLTLYVVSPRLSAINRFYIYRPASNREDRPIYDLWASFQPTLADPF